MGCFTIYCPISGLPLEFYYEDNNENKRKYEHLNEAVVVLPDGSITEIGRHDSYGRIYTTNTTYSCNDDESDDYQTGIAISNSLYKLMLLNPKFEDFMNKTKNLYYYLKNYSVRIQSNVMRYSGSQFLSLENILKDDLIYFVDPFLEEKIEEPLLGKTLIRGIRKINGKKNKIFLNKLIENFLEFIPKKKEEKNNFSKEYLLLMCKMMTEDKNISDNTQKEIDKLIEDFTK